MKPSTVALLNNKLATQLYEVGNGLMPVSKQNSEQFAWDYYVAHKIEHYGKACKDKARKEAIKYGVMFDHKVLPKPPGTDEVVYAGDAVCIKVYVKNPSVSFNHLVFFRGVLDAGLISAENKDLFQSLYASSFTENTAAHTFTAELTAD